MIKAVKKILSRIRGAFVKEEDEPTSPMPSVPSEPTQPMSPAPPLEAPSAEPIESNPSLF